MEHITIVTEGSIHMFKSNREFKSKSGCCSSEELAKHGRIKAISGHSSLRWYKELLI